MFQLIFSRDNLYTLVQKLTSIFLGRAVLSHHQHNLGLNFVLLCFFSPVDAGGVRRLYRPTRPHYMVFTRCYLGVGLYRRRWEGVYFSLCSSDHSRLGLWWNCAGLVIGG